MSREIVIKHDPPEAKPGWPCPRCHGAGYNADGSCSWSPTETRIRPPSKCYLCKGKGRVKVEALDE